MSLFDASMYDDSAFDDSAFDDRDDVPSEPPRARAGGRVPAAQVTVAADAHPEPFRHNGIVKGGSAQVGTAPFEIHTVELVPDFPLSDEMREALGEAEADESEALKERLEEQEAAWQARLDAEVARAREEARAEGYAAARRELEAEFETHKDAVRRDAEQLREAWKDFTRKTEMLLSNLAFEVAQQLLEAPLPGDVKAVSAQALTQALESLGDAAPVTFSLHPQDLERLEAYGLTEDLKQIHPRLHWEPDASLERGDWIAHSPEAAVRRLKSEVLAHLKNRLGLLAAMKNRRSEPTSD